MKVFILNLIKYAAISTVLFAIIFEIMFLPNGNVKISHYFSSQFSWLKVYERVQSSYKKHTFETLILGDSVAGQLFSFRPNAGYFTSNGSVYTAGNYILCKNIIEKNPSLKHVVYLSVPNVIGHRFERKRTCNNFVKPFYELSTIRLFDESTIHDINQSLFNFFYLFKLVKCLPIDDYDYSSDVKKNKFSLSSFSMLYLKKMSDLCKKNEIKLTIVSPPIPQARFNEFKQYEAEMILSSQKAGLAEEFQFYNKTIISLPDSNFKDGLHLKKEYLKKCKKLERDRIENLINRAFTQDQT
jgi:hypothetical protein